MYCVFLYNNNAIKVMHFKNFVIIDGQNHTENVFIKSEKMSIVWNIIREMYVM